MDSSEQNLFTGGVLTNDEDISLLTADGSRYQFFADIAIKNASPDNVSFGYFVVSAVPLPASAPMFGAALLGLAGLGYAAKRRKSAATL